MTAIQFHAFLLLAIIIMFITLSTRKTAFRIISTISFVRIAHIENKYDIIYMKCNREEGEMKRQALQ